MIAVLGAASILIGSLLPATSLPLAGTLAISVAAALCLVFLWAPKTKAFLVTPTGNQARTGRRLTTLILVGALVLGMWRTLSTLREGDLGDAVIESVRFGASVETTSGATSAPTDTASKGISSAGVDELSIDVIIRSRAKPVIIDRLEIHEYVVGAEACGGPDGYALEVTPQISLRQTCRRRSKTEQLRRLKSELSTAREN